MGETDEIEDEAGVALLDLPGPWYAVLGVVGAGALIAWANVIWQGVKQPGHVDDIASNPFLSTSALQISQLADQATARMVGALSIAGGITGAFAVLLVFALLFNAER